MGNPNIKKGMVIGASLVPFLVLIAIIGAICFAAVLLIAAFIKFYWLYLIPPIIIALLLAAPFVLVGIYLARRSLQGVGIMAFFTFIATLVFLWIFIYTFIALVWGNTESYPLIGVWLVKFKFLVADLNTWLDEFLSYYAFWKWMVKNVEGHVVEWVFKWLWHFLNLVTEAPSSPSDAI